MAKRAFSLSSVPDTVSIIQRRQKEREELRLRQETELKQIDDQISELTKDLQSRVENEETTGDRVRDLVIRVHGVDDVIEQKYRSTEARLIGKKGEFVLISYKTQIRTRHTFGRGWEYRGAKWFRLGVLEGEQLVWNPKVFITLPVSRYVGAESSAYFGDTILALSRDVQKENIFALHDIDDSPPLLIEQVQEQHGPIVEFVIGDADVRGWLKEHLMEDLFKLAAGALSKLILEPTEG